MQYSVIMSLSFFSWFDTLKDRRATAAIASRLKRVERGNLGDCKPVGHGVSEMRVDVGPGYRLYFCIKGNTIVLMLAGGDKSTQQSDIAAAIQLAEEVPL